MEPISTALLVTVLGNVAIELIRETCKDYLKDKLKSVFGWLEKLGERDKVELAYIDVMEQAYAACLEMLLQNIKAYGYSNEELKKYQSSIEEFIKDKVVAGQLLMAVQEPGRDDLPSPKVLGERWEEVGGLELPSAMIWNAVAIAFRRQVTKRSILFDDLRELHKAQNLQQLKELIERQGGVKVQVRRDKYSQRMRTKFSPVDLANLMPAYADDPGRMVIRDVFVAQNVRENPPPVEIPKDLAERLRERGRHEKDDSSNKDHDEEQFKKLHTTYFSQSPKPVMDVIAASGNRLLVLTGEPGSGKSTLMRYLVTGIVEPPVDNESGEPLPWTHVFKAAFPLLIELRDFYALRRSGDCDSFLEYVAYMGKVDNWFIDDHAVGDYLTTGPSLVMFDGLDEIFDTAERERVMQEIVGFAQCYRHTRIIVTSRPVGYKEQVLREAGFARFGIQDLDIGQIETFIRGWYALTFPQHPQQAKQRIERVLASARQSKPIQLLAGNPMLLTIMALLAREEELPRERAKFYEKAVEVLCHHWDANRNLELREDRYLNADDKKDLLRRIAMRMQAGDGGLTGNIIEEDALEQEIQTFLIDEQWQTDAAEAKRAARRMIRQLRERNYILCLRGPHLYGFVHRTFLEYLTAAEYVHRFDRQPQKMTIKELITLFDEHCREDDWREVLRLICGQIDEQFVGQIVERIVSKNDLVPWAIWRRQQPLPEIPLAIYCLCECRGLAKMEDTGQMLFELVIGLFVQAGDEGTIPSDVYDFLHKDLMQAAEEIGGRWPKKWRIGNTAHSQLSSMNVWGRELWPRFVAAVEPAREILMSLANEDGHPDSRSAALQALTEKWPDETTRKLLEERAVPASGAMAHSVALRLLAEKWPDTKTRELLTERVGKDESDTIRQDALWALFEQWPDEDTRELLMERAVQDEGDGPRNVALQALAEKWPDEDTRELLMERAVKDEDDGPRSVALQVLAEKWPDKDTRRLLTERAVQDENSFPRGAALRALVKNWSDEDTRRLLTERVVQDEGNDVRSVALESLSEKWSDEDTRELLTERAVQDENNTPRSTALRALVKNWSDEDTRRLLTERAVQDEGNDVRSAALKSLSEKWPDKDTRELLSDRTAQDESSVTRSTALEELSKKWPDEDTRELLSERAVQDENNTPRSAALRALVKNWPDEGTRRLLTERAVQDEGNDTRRAALRALFEQWPDEETCELLTERAVQDGGWTIRSAALDALSKMWPDEDTRRLLTERLVQDESNNVRSAALEALSEKWPDRDTRRLLTELALQDESVDIRSAALGALSDKWPDRDTRRLLGKRAVQDESNDVRSVALEALSEKWPDEDTRRLLSDRVPVDGYAATLHGTRHSVFGGVVFTRDLDGFGPYCEPSKPLTRKHIERAAEKASIADDKVDETVHSLSVHMGWDITKGSAG